MKPHSQHAPEHRQPVFALYVYGITATEIASGDLDEFVWMLGRCGGLHRPPVVADLIPWSGWAFESWWDCRRFHDFLIDFHGDDDADHLFMLEAARLERIAA